MLKSLKEGGKVMGRGMRLRIDEQFEFPPLSGHTLLNDLITLPLKDGLYAVSFKQFGYEASSKWCSEILNINNQGVGGNSEPAAIECYNVVVGEGGVMRFFRGMLLRSMRSSSPPDMHRRTVMYEPKDGGEGIREGLDIENTLTGYIYGVKKGRVVWRGAGVPGEVSLCSALSGAFLSTSLQTSWDPNSRTLHENEGEGEEHVADPSVESTSVFVIILFLIIVTICFEKTKDAVEEHSTKDMLPIIESLFAEMTILGFLSVITFVCTKVGVLEMISLSAFGDGDGDEHEHEENKEKLTEIFETVHYCLFAIMIFFVFQVIILVRLGTQSEAQWLGLDRACQDPATAKKILEGTQSVRTNSIEGLHGIIRGDEMERDVEDQRIFFALRSEFIKNREVMHPFNEEAENCQVVKDINFGRYLSMCMGETLAEVVEVSITTWAVMGGLAAAFYILMLIVKDDSRILGWTMVACAWFISTFNYVFEKKLLKIRNSFVPLPFLEAIGSSQNGGIKRRASELTALIQDDPTLPQWCNIDPSNYNIETRGPWMKFFFGCAPNRQQLLFWGQQEGPDLHILLLRIILLFNGLYTAVMLVTFGPKAYKDFGTPEFIAFCVTGVVPFFLQITGKRRLVATLCITNCIGCMRRNDIIANVIREDKVSRAVRAFIVLHKIHLATMSTGKPAKESKPRRHYSEAMPEYMLQDISKTFDLFDNDKGGSISTGELADLMESLGSPQDGDQLGVMISLLDSNDDGDISKEEFIQWYSDQLQKNELDPHEIAHSMFGMFDSDGSGSISIAEFKAALDAFDVGLSTDDVAELVKELDEDRNGFIDEEEFAHLLKRHSHPPPELSSLSNMV